MWCSKGSSFQSQAMRRKQGRLGVRTREAYKKGHSVSCIPLKRRAMVKEQSMKEEGEKVGDTALRSHWTAMMLKDGVDIPHYKATGWQRC